MSDEGRAPGVERAMRILAVLEGAGAAGLRSERLARIAGYGGGPAGRRRQLEQDVSELNRCGWEIVTVGTGTGGRYVLRSSGTRVRVRLDRAQEAELGRASRLAGGERTGRTVNGSHDADMRLCVRATGSRALVTFEYGGRARRVYPRSVQPGPSGWYLVGREDGQDVDKYFAVDRMADLGMAARGTASAPAQRRRSRPDPVAWSVDAPEEVVVEAAARFGAEVEQVLGPALRRKIDSDRVVLTIPVTHQATFRQRLYLLGARVRVVGPERVRVGILGELAELAGDS